MQRFADETRKDYLGGALMFLIGLGATVLGSRYRIGTLTDMGPGFFPVSLGIILALSGVAILTFAKLFAVMAVQKTKETKLHLEWVAYVSILTGIGAFGVLGKYGGLVPATFAIVFISAMGDRKNTWKSALILSLSMVTLAVVVFQWGLQLQFPLFSWG
ncbi:tripartite tricarboxylate transporter TctB family protein [Paraburkholderia sp. BL6669N2]|uniref:tripartite tricarboxylate transporter TctB family protein n=1 Tax=Paraburkholderia sp. BL6669N2 TaxID=1938807 RepID=UPI000E258334|nr:tripartite tricarboxylate transporter TctB family protein [Paraburkholderia sp. BL6669N2]REG50978.1 tripartite tricarboxylate transporter TctB family protein [Paraburkholderia sp. BL6669N2]